MRGDAIIDKSPLGESRAETHIHTSKYEMINVLMRQEDYESLKKQGGLHPEQITMALRHYLKLIAETKWRPEMSNAFSKPQSFATFQCSISKELWDHIRDLGGRVDSHTVEAIRLFLL